MGARCTGELDKINELQIGRGEMVLYQQRKRNVGKTNRQANQVSNQQEYAEQVRMSLVMISSALDIADCYSFIRC